MNSNALAKDMLESYADESLRIAALAIHCSGQGSATSLLAARRIMRVAQETRDGITQLEMGISLDQVTLPQCAREFMLEELKKRGLAQHVEVPLVGSFENKSQPIQR